MIMGEICTRRCPFCDVAHGKPNALDANEPTELASAISEMGLTQTVVQHTVHVICWHAVLSVSLELIVSGRACRRVASQAAVVPKSDTEALVTARITSSRSWIRGREVTSVDPYANPICWP